MHRNMNAWTYTWKIGIYSPLILWWNLLWCMQVSINDQYIYTIFITNHNIINTHSNLWRTTTEPASSCPKTFWSTAHHVTKAKVFSRQILLFMHGQNFNDYYIILYLRIPTFSSAANMKNYYLRLVLEWVTLPKKKKKTDNGRKYSPPETLTRPVLTCDE